MRRHPEVEQVGFVRFSDDSGDPVRAGLRMAGGEFCGNASCCAAVLWFLDHGTAESGAPVTVRLRVSGTSRPVEVRLSAGEDGSFSAGIEVPPARRVTEDTFAFGSLSGRLPVADLEGISHIIVPAGSAFFGLRDDPRAVEQALRDWCGKLGSEGLGLMFLEGNGPDYRLTPFVYIPGSGTFFRENSCASGSAAAAMFLARISGGPVSLTFREPGGTLRAESDPDKKQTRLFCRVRVLARFPEGGA